MSARPSPERSPGPATSSTADTGPHAGPLVEDGLPGRLGRYRVTARRV
jgi:hypothetical protein